MLHIFCFHIHTIQTDMNGPTPARQNIVLDKRCHSVTLPNVAGVKEHCHEIHINVLKVSYLYVSMF